MLIGITGQKQNGKNTICNFIINECSSSKIKIHSFANPIREIGRIFGFSEEEMNIKKEEVNSFWLISWLEQNYLEMVIDKMFGLN